MSELKLQQDPTLQQEVAQNHEALTSQSLMEDISAYGIEVEDKEGVAEALDTLRSEFEIDDTAFERPRNKFVLVAAADRLNTMKRGDKSHSRQISEMEYVADIVMDAVGEHTAFRDQFNQSVEKNNSTKREKDAYDRYTQPELTKGMDKLVRGIEFDELRKALGVEQEEPYEVRVLSIDTPEGSLSHGMDPGVNWDEEGASDELALRNDFKKGLIDNGRKFVEDLGREEMFAPAWVATFEDGTKYLCIAQPTAEKVLYKDEDRSAHYGEDDYTRDLAIVKHEYVHTQKALTSNGNIGLGIALEELRAEHFSGDRHGYSDIKKFFQGMKMLTGYSPKDALRSAEGGYNEEQFMAEIARNVGLDGLLESMVTIPSNYAEDEGSTEYVRAIVAHNGGNLSAQFANMYQRIGGKIGKDKLESNISAFIDNARGLIKGKQYITVESFLAHGGNTSIRDIGIENFRRRYPDESDGYDYSN